MENSSNLVLILENYVEIKRTRFSELEKRHLLEIIESLSFEEKTILRSKSNKKEICKLKDILWDRITSKFNELNSKVTQKQLYSLFYNLLKWSKKRQNGDQQIVSKIEDSFSEQVNELCSVVLENEDDSVKQTINDHVDSDSNIHSENSSFLYDQLVSRPTSSKQHSCDTLTKVESNENINEIIPNVFIKDGSNCKKRKRFFKDDVSQKKKIEPQSSHENLIEMVNHFEEKMGNSQDLIKIQLDILDDKRRLQLLEEKYLNTKIEAQQYKLEYYKQKLFNLRNS